MINDGLRLQAGHASCLIWSPPTTFLLGAPWCCAFILRTLGSASHPSAHSLCGPRHCIPPGPRSGCMAHWVSVWPTELVLSWIGEHRGPHCWHVSASESRLNITDKISEQEGLQLLNMRRSRFIRSRVSATVTEMSINDAVFEYDLSVESFKNILINPWKNSIPRAACDAVFQVLLIGICRFCLQESTRG